MKKIKLNIDSPCSEEWTSMDSVTEGKHCDICSKNVIDFTSFNDKQLIDYLSHINGKICGKLKTSQLNREIFKESSTPKFYGFLSVLSGLVIFASSNKILAKGHEQRITIQEANSEQFKFHKKQEIKKDSIKYEISGTIFESESSEPLPGASIELVGKKYGISTKADGTFKLEIPEKFLSETLTIRIIYIGFKNQEFTVTRDMLPLRKNYYLENNELQLLGEVVIINKKKWWQFKKKKCQVY
jgi:hypothetical protein